MSEELRFTVEKEHKGARLDKFLVSLMENTTRAAVQRLIENGDVHVNGKNVKSNYSARFEDTIEVIVPEPSPIQATAEAIPLEIMYEDDDLLVVNKPRGMVVHPAAGNPSGTLVNALLFHCGDSLSGINGKIRPGIVHRIDKDTSGLLIVAKNDFAHQHLAEQIKVHSFKREYEALACGALKNDAGVIDLPIGRSEKDRKRMAVTTKNAKNAITHYQVLSRYQGYTHLRLNLKTGRTHQIRVHLSYLGHPIAGDSVYGHKKDPLNLRGQCLHAKLIGFIHPRSQDYIEISSDLPGYFVGALGKLQEENA